VAQVEFDLKFKASNTTVIDDVETKISKLDEKLSKKFKIGLDSEDFKNEFNSLIKSLSSTKNMDKSLKNFETFKNVFKDFDTKNLDISKISAFISEIEKIKDVELAKIIKNINSLIPALSKLNSIKTPSLNSFYSGLKKLEDGNFDISKIESVIKTINSFPKIVLKIEGVQDLSKLIRLIGTLDGLKLSDAFFKNINKLSKTFDKLKINAKMEGLEDLKTFINRLRSLDKLQINEQKFLKKMETVKKGFEQLSQAKVDIQKIKAMAETMREISTVVRESSRTSGLDTGTIAGMLGGFITVQSIGSMVQDAKELEYAILQVGVAGELTRTQMDMLKNEMYDFSRATGKSALEITQALDSIIKTGQAVDDSRKILEGAVMASVSSGEPLLNTADALSKMLLTMGIGADKTIEVLDMFQSVMNKTPASMRSLQEGLKQSGAGFANYTETTSKSGKSLEDYKMKILETEMAMLGSQAKMGRLGEQSGRICA